MLLPQTQKSDVKTYWLSREQQSVLVQNWKSTEYDSAVLMKFSLPVPHEKVHLSKTAPEAIRPQDGGSERGGCGNGRGDNGVLLPGGDLISEISLRLTKLSVKQSLVGSRVEGGERGRLRG